MVGSAARSYVTEERIRVSTRKSRVTPYGLQSDRDLGFYTSCFVIVTVWEYQTRQVIFSSMKSSVHGGVLPFGIRGGILGFQEGFVSPAVLVGVRRLLYLRPESFGCKALVDENQCAWLRDSGASIEKSELQNQCTVVEGHIEAGMKEYTRRRKPLEETVRAQREELERRKVRGKPVECRAASVVGPVGLTVTVGCGLSRGVGPRFPSYLWFAWGFRLLLDGYRKTSARPQRRKEGFKLGLAAKEVGFQCV